MWGYFWLAWVIPSSLLKPIDRQVAWTLLLEGVRYGLLASVTAVPALNSATQAPATGFGQSVNLALPIIFVLLVVSGLAIKRRIADH